MSENQKLPPCKLCGLPLERCGTTVYHVDPKWGMTNLCEGFSKLHERWLDSQGQNP